MIIVSQDKTGITNFDNVNTLRVTKTGEIISFDNSYRSEDNCSDVLGQYSTEERAKEVLQEIIKCFSFTELRDTPERLKLILEITKLGRYQMPKE